MRTKALTEKILRKELLKQEIEVRKALRASVRWRCGTHQPAPCCIGTITTGAPTENGMELIYAGGPEVKRAKLCEGKVAVNLVYQEPPF